MSFLNASKVVLGFMLAITTGLVLAAGMKYEEGTHYVVLHVPIETANPNKIEVTEYFSYGCPHCYEFEPIVSAWQQGLDDDVEFNRTPALWSKDYELYGQSYYTVEVLGVLEKVHIPLFELIQQRRPKDAQVIALALADYGVDPIDFARMFGSFEVDKRLGKARARGKGYAKADVRGIGVPTMIVNGKYRIDGKMAGGNVAMLQVVEHLIALERKAMAEPAE